MQLINAPGYYLRLFTDLPVNLRFDDVAGNRKDFIHFLSKEKAEYREQLPLLKSGIKQNGIIWISWPKKASKVATDLTENEIRDYALQTGLVDIKVCAVDEVWSGLKLVIPVKDKLTVQL